MILSAFPRLYVPSRVPHPPRWRLSRSLSLCWWTRTRHLFRSLAVVVVVQRTVRRFGVHSTYVTTPAAASCVRTAMGLTAATSCHAVVRIAESRFARTLAPGWGSHYLIFRHDFIFSLSEDIFLAFGLGLVFVSSPCRLGFFSFSVVQKNEKQLPCLCGLWSRTSVCVLPHQQKHP
jgi:hypothetical protein